MGYFLQQDSGLTSLQRGASVLRWKVHASVFMLVFLEDFNFMFAFKGQTSWHNGSLHPFKWWPGPDGAESPQEVCGPGNSAHASPWLSCAGDEALCEGVGLPRGADRLTYQQLGSERPWALPFLCCETLHAAVLFLRVDHTYQCIVPLYSMSFVEISWSRCVCAIQAAEELGCSIFVHPWDMQTDGRMAKYWLPWLVGEGDKMKSEKQISNNPTELVNTKYTFLCSLWSMFNYLCILKLEHCYYIIASISKSDWWSHLKLLFPALEKISKIHADLPAPI